MIEAIGYIGSAIVLVSFLMTSVVKLRVINTIGSVIFTIYALIIGSYPTAVMNLCLALINIHFLWKRRHTGREYDLVEVDPQDRYFQYLLHQQEAEIRRCFPHIDLTPNQDSRKLHRGYLITCQNAPAGMVLGDLDKEGTLELRLDYSLPEYRDFSIGAFLTGRLKSEGVKKLTYQGPAQHHQAYLKRIGFEKHGAAYEKIL